MRCNIEKIDNLEIEVKFNANGIDRLVFKDLVKSLNPKDFLYVESTDTYYLKTDNDFLRYRASAENSKSKRAELTFKRKHNENNNIIRTEVNLRVDNNTPQTVQSFAEGLGYVKNFSIWKACDVFYFEDCNIVYYSVKDESNKYNHFIEIEVLEGLPETKEQGLEILRKYEKLLEPLNLTYKNRLNKSLFEMYRKEKN